MGEKELKGNLEKIEIKNISLGKDNIDSSDGIGIDIGIKNFVVTSYGGFYKNINDTERVKGLNKRIKKIRNDIRRKIKTNYLLTNEESEKTYSYIESNNIIKLKNKLLAVKEKIRNIRRENIKKICSEIIEKDPKYITIENLNIEALSKNRRIKEHILYDDLNMFIKILEYKCKRKNIQLRMVNRNYPSSKICSKCGNINNNLKLSDKVFRCSCGNEIDRDLNAAINLLKAKEYKIIC